MQLSAPIMRLSGFTLAVLVVPVLHSAGQPDLSIGNSIAIFVSAAISSVAGFAFAAISGAYLFHTHDSPIHVVQTIVMCSVALQVVNVVALAPSLNYARIARFIGGGLLGLPVGLFLLYHAVPALYARLLGAFLVGFVVVRLVIPAMYTVRTGTVFGGVLDAGAGLLGGITGGFAGFPGAFVTVWCGLRGWDKLEQRATFSTYILAMQLFTLAAIAAYGPVLGKRSAAFDPASLAYVPGAVAGTLCGIALFRRLSTRQFEKVVLALLIASGIGMLF